MNFNIFLSIKVIWIENGNKYFVYYNAAYVLYAKFISASTGALLQTADINIYADPINPPNSLDDGCKEILFNHN